MLKASGVYEAFFIETFQPVYRNRSIIPQYRKNLVPSPHTAGKPAYQNQAFTCESKRSIRCHSMEMVDKHRECLKRISTPVISIGKRIPEFNRVRLWFDNNLADHFIRFLQGNGNHKRRFSRQNICSTALNHFRNFRVILRLSFLIAGTYLVVSIIKHDVRILRHQIPQNKPFCFQKIHNFYQYSAFFSAYSCSSSSDRWDSARSSKAHTPQHG